MQIACPDCEKQLRVRESLAGKLVKCPSCGRKFKADDSGVEEVLTAPARAQKQATPVGPKQLGPKKGTRQDASEREEFDENDGSSRRRRMQDNAAADRGSPSRRRQADDEPPGADEDRKELRRKARQRSKGAGILLLVAGLFLFAAVALNISASMHLETKFYDSPYQRTTYKQALYGSAGLGMLAALCHLLASAGLRSFRMKALVPVSAVLGLVFTGICGYGVYFNLQLVAVIPAEYAFLLTAMIVVFGVTGLLNLLAALMAILVLREPVVRQAYRAG